MSDSEPENPGPGGLKIPYVFVPEGETPPSDMMAGRNGWVRFPVRRRQSGQGSGTAGGQGDGATGGQAK